MCFHILYQRIGVCTLCSCKEIDIFLCFWVHTQFENGPVTIGKWYQGVQSYRNVVHVRVYYHSTRTISNLMEKLFFFLCSYTSNAVLCLSLWNASKMFSLKIISKTVITNRTLISIKWQSDRQPLILLTRQKLHFMNSRAVYCYFGEAYSFEIWTF